MKKIFAIALTVAMILSMGAVVAFAANGNASYGPEGPEAFTAVEGTIALTWLPDADEKINLTDGDLDDWFALGLTPLAIDDTNVVTWFNAIPEDFEMNAYFVADATYLYVAFNIVDSDVVTSKPKADPLDYSTGEQLTNYNTGDNFQMNIDFGNKIKWLIDNDPNAAEEMTNAKAVFYSLGYKGDGENVYIAVQESDDNRILGEGDGATVDHLNGVDSGTKGKTYETTDGWAAEFRIPFSEFFYDYCYKSWNESEEGMEANAITVDEDHPLEIGIGLYNLNWSHTDNAPDGELYGAYGLHNGTNLGDDGMPIVTWGPDDLATKLSLAYVEGMAFTTADFGDIADLAFLNPSVTVSNGEGETTGGTSGETETAGGTSGETETAGGTSGETETETEIVTETETETETENSGETTGETKAETEAPAADGCASVVGFGAVAVLAAAAAAVVLKKKD